MPSPYYPFMSLKYFFSLSPRPPLKKKKKKKRLIAGYSRTGWDKYYTDFKRKADCKQYRAMNQALSQ